MSTLRAMHVCVMRPNACHSDRDEKDIVMDNQIQQALLITLVLSLMLFCFTLMSIKQVPTRQLPVALTTDLPICICAKFNTYTYIHTAYYIRESSHPSLLNTMCCISIAMLDNL